MISGVPEIVSSATICSSFNTKEAKAAVVLVLLPHGGTLESCSSVRCVSLNMPGNNRLQKQRPRCCKKASRSASETGKVLTSLHCLEIHINDKPS